MRAFDVYRLPWHHDRSFSASPFESAKLYPLLKYLGDAKVVDDACEELRAMHTHTKNVLRSAGLTHLTLRRGLRDIEKRSWGFDSQHRSGYATRLIMMAEAAKRLNLPSFELVADVLSSWSAGGYSQYAATIERDVSIEDIAWGSSTIASNEPGRDAIEYGEWVVINRASDGRITLPVEAVIAHRLEPASIRLPSARPELVELLAELSAVYGVQSSMLRDHPSRPNARVTWPARLRRAWAALHDRSA